MSAFECPKSAHNCMLICVTSNPLCCNLIGKAMMSLFGQWPNCVIEEGAEEVDTLQRHGSIIRIEAQYITT